ncbi:hypothetical protein B0T18DRAFT_487464 [Schizothecium vesticola]|uniref:Uncharacterized protein n=1 Tax=Schizothecium vesticola TaxID=314040 RepID=A0AA40F1N2_9PEZI|nr:hypothetical protein B0T18DRAFT_487464 [Schizothecium vesticola]
MITTASNRADEMSPRGKHTFGGAMCARSFVALRDAELDRYLEQYRLDDGVAIDIEVEDPERWKTPRTCPRVLSSASGTSDKRYADCAYNTIVRHFRLDSPSYSAAASALLAKYRVTTRPVQFHQDPAQAWKTLVNSTLLRPYETEEYVCAVGFGQAYRPEMDQLFRALGLAELAFEAARKGSTSRPGPHSTHFLSVAAGRTKLDEANEAWQLFDRRMGLFAEFRHGDVNFDMRKDDIKRQECLVQWILDEMPLVEAELRKSGVSEVGPDAVGDAINAGHDPGGTAAVSYQRARKRGREETPTNDAMPAKRLKTVDRQTIWTLARQDPQMFPHLDHNPDHSGGGIPAQATPHPVAALG